MKNFILVVVVFLISCSSPKDKWYSGGNLHKAQKAQWVVATTENKLATCADYVANFKKLKNEAYTNMDEMKADATSLMACIDASLSDLPEHQPIGEIAAACHILSKK